MDFTEKQQHAIGARGKSVLVSAAAGSGKTSVLTSRIVDLIVQGADIRRMLVATFTNAAAGEMKTRITRALAQKDKDSRIREQADFVYGAGIGTFHSICSRIIRENYNLIGVSPAFKILSDRETQRLRQAAMDDVLDSFYAEQDAGFLRLVDRYVRRGNDSGIADMVFCLHAFVYAKPDPLGWLDFAEKIPYEEYAKHAGADNETVRDEYNHTMPDVQAIVRATRAFGESFAAKKREKNSMDYADLLHGALQVLRQRSYDYDYVFVDEYQDTNPVQEQIIRLLSREDNLFMVGDIKQSIYKFNLADPEIILKKAKEFRHPDFGGELVCMNENFRCSAPIIEAVNGIMERVMSPELGEIEYTPDERLICKKNGTGEVQVLLCTEAGEDKNIGEASMIADKICGLVADGTVRWSDIALLVRSRSEFMEAVWSVFQNRNIPLVFDTDEKRNIPELDLFVNILRVIENPRQDIALISALRSYAGALDENDLAAIRLLQKKGPFYLAAERYAEEMEDATARKLNAFFSKTAYLRVCAVAEDFDDFLHIIADTFAFPDYMRCIGGNKGGAFDALLQQCSELGGNGSLHEVISALEQIKRRDGSYVKTRPLSGADAVRLMTMHHAKGLEFPVVFLCNLQRQFVMRELYSNVPVVVHSDMGILPNYVDEEKCVRRSTAAREAAVSRLKSEYKSEDLRILYVAMTRAQNSLYLCGSVNNSIKAAEKWNEYMSGKKAYSGANCMLDWVMGALPQHVEVVFSESKQMLQRKSAPDMDALRRELLSVDLPPREIFALPKAEKVPAKLSVSEIKKQDRPMRVGVRAVTDENRITGAKLGTLVHAVMERMEFKNDTALQTADMLFEREIISPAEREAIIQNAGMVDAFFKTELAGRIRRSEKVIREMPFNLLVAADTLGYSGKALVSVQGVLDLAFMENGNWVLVDYKTDHIGKDVESFKQMYCKQLSLYAEALEKITGIPVAERYLCFLRANLQVKV